MSSPVLLVLGAGGGVGLSVLKKFKAEGYKTAAVARNPSDAVKAASDKTYTGDLADPPEAVEKIFDSVRSDLGDPNVVVYNAYAVTVGADADPFAALSPQQLQSELAIGVTSFYAVAQRFAVLPPSPHPKCFIYTGNGTTKIICPAVFGLGVSKNAASYIIETAAYSYGKAGKGEKGFWYWADERREDGLFTPKTNGDGHADLFWELVNKKEQGPWNQTFVPGKGYVDFDKQRDKEVFLWETIIT